MNKFWSKYPEIQNELNDVVNLIEKNAKCKDKIIESSILELVRSGGKMVRPAFVILASKFGEDYNKEGTQALASVMEMFHMATLVHDDVIDDARLRRGQETIQSKYGKNYAVYIGDYLFCICFKILAQTASTHSLDVDTKSMSRICLGEIEQLNSRFDRSVSVKNYLQRISGKTAELFSLSLYLGAAESKCSKKMCRKFWQIGHNIGMAFQIIDDILDYTGSDESIKKDAANDLKQGLYTLPLLLAAKKNNKELNTLLDKEEYSDQDISNIMKMVTDLGGVEKAVEVAEKYSKKAFKDIESLPDNQYKQILLEVAEGLLNRKH